MNPEILMTDLFRAAATPTLIAATQIRQFLTTDAPLTRALLNASMTDAFGGTDADGRWTQRDSFEALEHALALHLVASKQSLQTAEDLRAVINLAARMPTQTVRSEEQVGWQQFSTPVDVAALAVLLAQVQPTDIILEPSAGNGLLVAHCGPHAALHLNELDSKRRARLACVFPNASVTGHDGASINATLQQARRPTLILMNPPFSRSAGRGADEYAAVRHLQAALGILAPGGRLVAIMPNWFGPDARMREQFRTIFREASVHTSLRLEKCYAKHGTSIAVRLFVVDKIPGGKLPVTIARTHLADFLDCITVTPRCAISAIAAAPARRNSPISLFRAAKTTRPARAPKTWHAPVRNDVLPVPYTALETPTPLLEQTGIYLPYRPSRTAFDSAGEHPTPLVESIAMGSIPAPIPGYVPRLPERTVSERLLSAAQLETAVYAGHAWSHNLPGRFKPDKEGVGLTIAEDGDTYRKGFFLGDGTGAGKGRQIAACILDNWLQGRRCSIWVTKNEPLLEDARRDWTALGGVAADIQSVSNWKIDTPITLPEGVLFVTYPTLRSMRSDHSRLQQILDWAGPGFDGVIAFDEAHEMGGVAGGEGARGKKNGSQQGTCGVRLQNHLPSARVLYASATGASDVNNFAYAVRLGLWGPETAFAHREKFISEIRAGGIAAMELVARDLKAMGLYHARALSFAGVEYEILKHSLSEGQIRIYDTYADTWAIIHRNMESALELTNVVDGLERVTLNSGAKSAARSRIQSTMQRFFGQVLLSMKLPTVIAAAEDHLDQDQSVVLQLVTTAESILDRRLDGMSPDERETIEIDLSPVDYMVDYLSRAFPTRQMQLFTDDTGQTRSEPMHDEHGNPVYNPDAEAARDRLIEHICALPPIKSALDGLLEYFGHERVVEITGRTKRLITTANGAQKLECRSARSAQADADAFMSGEKRILVFSDAGGTGRSYHADLAAKNQQQRVHFLLEPGWRADRAIQGLGRTHRTNQASPPLFRPVTTNCKGELRFTSTIARRLDSLGALTRGQRQTGGQNLFDPADNLESAYARAALQNWFRLLVGGKPISIGLNEFEERSGLEMLTEDGALREDLPPIQRWLNRLLALPIGLQNSIFDEFLSLVETRIAAAQEAGRLDVGVETIPVEDATILDDTVLRTDRLSGATSHLLTLEIARRRKTVSLERILRIADADPSARTLRNSKSGKVALQIRARSLMEEIEGTPIPRVELMRPTRNAYFRVTELAETAWQSVDRDVFMAAWMAEVTDAVGTLERDTIHLATGLLLPVWSALPIDHLVVNRIVTSDGRSWLERLVFDPQGLCKSFGIAGTSQQSANQIVRAALAGQESELTRPFPMTVKRSLVNGKHRIELAGCPVEQLPWLKSLGAFTEIIQYRTRVFLPAGKAEAILKQILGNS